MNVDLGTNDRTRLLTRCLVMALAGVALATLSPVAAGGEEDDPIVGRIVYLDDPIEINVPPASDPSVPVWTEEFRFDDAGWIEIRFAVFDLPPEPEEPESRGRLVFRDPKGVESTPYWENGPERLIPEEGGMHTDFFRVEGVTLTLYGDPIEPITIVIDSWAYGLPDEGGSGDADDEACFHDVKCLDGDDPRYKAAKAVARIYYNRRSSRTTVRNATAFLYECPSRSESDPPQNLLMAAGHSLKDLQGFSAEFMAERKECKDPVDADKKCPGKHFKGKVSTVKVHDCCDVGIIELKAKPGETYGLLELKSEKDLKRGESDLFVPQHPNEHCKEYSEGKYDGPVSRDRNPKKCLHDAKVGGDKGASGSPFLHKFGDSGWKVVGILTGGFDPTDCESIFTGASRAIAAFCARSGSREQARVGDCEICIWPDQLHIVGPVPNELSVGEEGTITATVQANFCGIPGMEVVFTTLAGELTYTDGFVSEDGSEAILYTPEEGQVEMPFIADGPGPALIEVAVTSGNELSTFSFFEILGAPLVPGGDDLQTDPPSSNEDDQAGADVLDDLLFGDPSTLNDDADPNQDRPDDPSATDDDGVDLPDADGRTTSGSVPQGTCGALGLITMSAMCGALLVLRVARRRRSL